MYEEDKVHHVSGQMMCKKVPKVEERNMSRVPSIGEITEQRGAEHGTHPSTPREMKENVPRS